VFLCVVGAVAALPAEAPFAQAEARLRSASAFIAGDYDRFVRELVALNEVPAPPFREERRAKTYRAMLQEAGLTDVEMDAEGNVMGLRRGTGGGPLLAIAAHLDTVFPEGTDVKVKRAGTRLLAPGIADNTRSLAVLLAVIRAMNAAGLRTPGDILFVGNVGEEGEGDLRGVKYLFGKGKYKDRIRRFLALESGDQDEITRGGVGSRRYRVTFKGPGGHSFGAFGLVNPVYAMAAAISGLSEIQVPPAPRTTYNVGIVRGGTSVNSIPFEVSMDVDMRSESCDELKKIEARFLPIVKAAAANENRVRSTRLGPVEVGPNLIGDRPCGETPLDSDIVQTASRILRTLGLTPSYGTSSTDSNVPMSLGIPAITIRSGPGGRSHSLDEWTDVERQDAVRSIEVVLAMIVGVARMP
jgi:acetylornithine deacetylase/succinyl-diaminopimelate desuccinylase-like protein